MEIWGKKIQCGILVKREKIGTVWKLGNIGTVMNTEEKGRECCAGTLPLYKQNLTPASPSIDLKLCPEIPLGMYSTFVL